LAGVEIAKNAASLCTLASGWFSVTRLDIPPMRSQHSGAWEKSVCCSVEVVFADAGYRDAEK
jgi:hypothetical protein